MNQLLLVLAVALTVGAIVFGVIALLGGDDKGLQPVEPDGRSLPLPSSRPLVESDVAEARFDTAWRGYRMAQVDAALQRLAYDIGYKDELIKVLHAEVDALREGRFPDAEVLRRAREAALAQVELTSAPVLPSPADDPPVVVPVGDVPVGEDAETLVVIPAAAPPAEEQPPDESANDEPTTGESAAGEPATGEPAIDDPDAAEPAAEDVAAGKAGESGEETAGESGETAGESGETAGESGESTGELTEEAGPATGAAADGREPAPPGAGQTAITTGQR